MKKISVIFGTHPEAIKVAKNRLTKYLILPIAVLSVAQSLTAEQDVPVEMEMMMADEQLSLLWDSEPGVYYETFTKTNLTDPSWDTATGSLVLSTGIVAQVALPASDPVAFFKVLEIGTNRNDMALIPAGSFSMGDSFNEGELDERPVHTVDISAFYMGKYRVTKALWDDVYTWSLDHDYSFDNPGSGKALNHPVVSITWYDIFKWCNARSEKEELEPCYTIEGSIYRTGQHEPDCDWNANGYRLPTEAEWEKACRGGQSGLRFPWGGAYITHTNANYCGDDWFTWYNKSSGYHPLFNDGVRPYTNPVDYFEPNGYGLYDMVGNVWDSCWDWYDAGYYTNSPPSDPHGPSSGTYRVERGNGWLGWGKNSRSARRAGVTPLGVRDHRGFRVCLPAD